MNRRTLYAALSASLLLCFANLSFAADKTPDSADDSATMHKAKEASKKPNAELEAKRKAAAKIKLVNINGASKEELMKLPNISEADAEKIIAGRPYATKAHLLTHKVLPEGTYLAVKGLVIAKQPSKDAAKNAALYAPKNAPKK